MTLKVLALLYLSVALFGALVFIAPGNARKMFGSGSKTEFVASAIHGWLVLGTVAACGISGWVAPVHAASLAWAVVALAFFGHLLVTVLAGRPVHAKRLAIGTALQAVAAVAVTAAAGWHVAEG